MVTATETYAYPQNAYIDLLDVEHLHHTRCEQFYWVQFDRFTVLRKPKSWLNFWNGIMMFTDNYLDARAIQYYFETKTQGLCSAALLHDEYNEGHSAYVVYVNITMEDYKELLVTAESAATGGE